MNKFNRRMLLLAAASALCITGCAQSHRGDSGPEFRGGMVVVVRLAPGAAEKMGLVGTTNTGQRMFGSAVLGSHNGETSSFGSQTRTLPRWVQVTWRDSLPSQPENNYYTAGKQLGSVRVDVRERIPASVVQYIEQKPGRALVLRFRIKDDAVLLAWDVQESSPNGQGWNYSMHGGDFLGPELYNGKVIDPGWERPQRSQ